MRDMLSALLRSHGWTVATAGDGLTALGMLEEDSGFSAVIADYGVPGPSGLRVLEHARLVNPACRLVLFGGYLPHDAKEWARANGAVALRKGASESVAILLAALEETA